MENSKILLEHALEIIKGTSFENKEWRIGGGTILAQYFNHRISKDIDIFIDDIQCIKELSPIIKDVDEMLDYNEMSNFISYTFKEGKVDFICGPQISKFPPYTINFKGVNVSAEHPVEIVTKKIFHRGNMVKPRDLFDIAVVCKNKHENDILNTLQSIPEQTNDFIEKYNYYIKKKALVPYSKTSPENILEGGKKFIGKELKICDDLLKKYKTRCCAR